MKLIEFVCTANYGRSTMAEAFAREYLEILKEPLYDSKSSGSNIFDIENHSFPFNIMSKYVNLALERGDIFKKSYHKDIENSIISKNPEKILPFYIKASDIFKKEEHEHRKYIIDLFGFEGKVKERSDQTIYDPNSVAIFGMTQANTYEIKKIYYGKSGHIIENLAKYSKNKSITEIPDTFGKDLKSYIETIVVIRNVIPQTIDRVLNNS